MKSLIATCAAALLCLSCITATAQPDTATPTPKASKAQRAGKAKSVDLSLFVAKEYQKDGLTLPYRVLFPENMQQGKKYPLFLFLHGMGLRGTDNVTQLRHSSVKMFMAPANREQYPCIVLYPQAPTTSAFVEILDDGKIVAKGGFTELPKAQASAGKDAAAFTMRLSPYGNMVMDVVNQLIASGNVDTDRIYVAGSSMGGFSTYAFITQYPGVFAAAAPMAGATEIATMPAWAGKVPIWIFHGGADPTVPVEGDRTVVAKLKEMGAANFKYTEYPGCGHDCWAKAFAEPDYLPWFFSHSKNTTKQ